MNTVLNPEFEKLLCGRALCPSHALSPYSAHDISTLMNKETPLTETRINGNMPERTKVLGSGERSRS